MSGLSRAFWQQRVGRYNPPAFAVVDAHRVDPRRVVHLFSAIQATAAGRQRYLAFGSIVERDRFVASTAGARATLNPWP